MKNTYRVVKDKYLGFEAQVKYWWFPFMWVELATGDIFGSNTHSNLESAQAMCQRHAVNGDTAEVASYLGKL